MTETIVVTVERAGDSYGFDQHGRALITWRVIDGTPSHCQVCGARITGGWSVSENRRFIGHVCDAHVQVIRK